MEDVIRALKDSLPAILSESKKNAPTRDKPDLTDLLAVDQGRWERYFDLLYLEVVNEAALAQGGKAAISNAKHLPQERRQLVKALKKSLGRWPTIDDATAQLFVSEVPADVKLHIAEDLKRLQV